MPFGRRPATRVDGILVAGAGADVKKSARLRQGRAKGRSLYRESIDAANDQARNLALGFKSHFATRSSYLSMRVHDSQWTLSFLDQGAAICRLQSIAGFSRKLLIQLSKSRVVPLCVS
jgi:hypothetical protein